MTFLLEEIGLSYCVYSLLQGLLRGTIIFDLMTLTLKFDLLLKNLTLFITFLLENFLTRSDKAFILHVRIPCDKTFLMVQLFMTS